MAPPLQIKHWTSRLTLLSLAWLAASAIIPSAQAQTYTILYSFQGENDGAYPHGVIVDAQGNLYGTTSAYGGYSYDGTAFKLNPLNQEAILYKFLAGYGSNPFSGVIEDARGDFFGATLYGGSYGLGTVFGIDAKGNEVVLHNFTGVAGDGEYPEGGLLQDAAGNLYGTALYAGKPGCGNGMGCGMVFKISKTGEETQLHIFTGHADGGWPIANLVSDKVGNLYGTASGGGDTNCDGGYGCGTVFKIDAQGNYTVLYTFTGGTSDGATPEAGLILDSAGNLYGTTQFGGTAGLGTVFKLDPAGQETVLYSFLGPPEDGSFPAFSPLFRDAAGNLYGETTSGGDPCSYGVPGCGIIFMLNPSGKETVLHYFMGSGDGAYPVGGLTPDGKGNLYGATGYGGPFSNICIDYDIEYGCGTVFKLTP
jgi:uncharacterized repeat protein (TIGR03803 family)